MVNKLINADSEARYIMDFSAGRAVGSTGSAPWFKLKSDDQKKFLKGKVCLTYQKCTNSTSSHSRKLSFQI